MKTRDDRKKEKHIVHKTSNLINDSAEDEKYSTQKFRTCKDECFAQITVFYGFIISVQFVSL